MIEYVTLEEMDAYKQGFVDFKQNKDNPYTYNSSPKLRQCWLNGWFAACEQEEERLEKEIQDKQSIDV